MEEVQREGFIFLQMSQYLTVSEADSSYRGAEMQGPGTDKKPQLCKQKITQSAGYRTTSLDCRSVVFSRALVS
jgi:hypothetical protein